MMTPQDFIEAIGPQAQASMRQTGLSAAFTIAEAALESGWGSSQLAQNAHNLFGVKVYPGWDGGIMDLPTKEYEDGEWVTVPAQWCVYPSWEQSITDHARFFYTNPRYAVALQSRAIPQAFAQAVQAAGYATDPAYAQKIIAIIQAHGLSSWDVPPSQWALADWAQLA